MSEYNHKEIENKWRDFWEKNHTFKTADSVPQKENEYILVEFPYPSGDLHIGHWYAFSVTDIYAKYQRMLGKNVLFPFGFDAFGLPAENAAIKRKVNPKDWTYSNIENMKKQIRYMGASFDLDRSVVTCSPEYYKWTQWIFIQMFKKGLAYKKRATVNWDPIDKTVLANEQVLSDGTAERSGAKVEKKEIEQWFLKITDYADRLVDDLDNLDWPKEIKEMQKNWIGRNKGAETVFEVKREDQKDLITNIPIFTTRLDTIFGVSCIILAPENKITAEIAENSENSKEIFDYIKQSSQKDEIERTANNKQKTGVLIKGYKAINPVNKTEIPIFVSDYVLANYGTGAIMAVPAHDERDHSFAKTFNLPIKKVIESEEKSVNTDTDDAEHIYTEKGTLINSEEFNGLHSDIAISKILEKIGAKEKTTYKLRDWSVGRQRYWGCPVPIVYDPNGKPHPIPDEFLPWTLPEDVDHNPTGEPPLKKSTELKQRTEEIFGKGWTPEIETLDTFVDSSWYYLRYLDSNNNSEIASNEKINTWMPVNFYSGGAEHTTLHLLYSRFFYKFFYDIGIVKTTEPYRKRLNRSLILGPDGNKMSKSKGNVINPDEIVERLGADTVRGYLAFIGPYNECSAYPWDTNGVVGVRRFFERVYKISNNLIVKESDKKLIIETHRLIEKTTKDYSVLKMNTVVASLMTFVNSIEKYGQIGEKEFSDFIKILSPIAPHIGEELWEKLGNKESVFNSSWPKFDPKLFEQEIIKIGVQINGKVRSELEISLDLPEEKIISMAIEKPEIKKWINNKTIKKTLYIKGKMINIIIVQ